MTDFRALCARMADELDHYRRLLTDNRLEVHALSAEARAALSAREQGPTDEEIMELMPQQLREDLATVAQLLVAHGTGISVGPGLYRVTLNTGIVDHCRAVLTRWGRPAVEPVPVAERPWEREGWCDKEGMCWMGDGGGCGFVPSWRLCKPSDSRLAWSLPHWALPVPQEGADGQH